MIIKSVTFFAWFLILLGTGILIYFIYDVSCEDYEAFSKSPIDFEISGQFGDFIGGVVGTLFALSGTFLIFITFKEQANRNRKDSFESVFFKMISLHRENVSDLTYTKYSDTNNKFETAENRKVFHLILNEFLDCYREVRKFSNSKNEDDYVLNKHKRFLQKIITDNNLKINLIELITIDIAYNIVFFGVGEEGEMILRDKFKRKYNHHYFYRILKYIKLKPKKENKLRWGKWKKLLEFGYIQFRQVNEEFYLYRPDVNQPISIEAQDLIFTNDYEKYYGGHQHRLGHYFRNLFQSYKYLNNNSDLTLNEKYFYGKTLRAQLSTYEQALLFINSISSLGLKWEYTPDIDSGKITKQKLEESRLISKYHLIKNLSGTHIMGLKYKNYYPRVKYEEN